MHPCTAEFYLHVTKGHLENLGGLGHTVSAEYLTVLLEYLDFPCASLSVSYQSPFSYAMHYSW